MPASHPHSRTAPHISENSSDRTHFSLRPQNRGKLCSVTPVPTLKLSPAGPGGQVSAWIPGRVTNSSQIAWDFPGFSIRKELSVLGKLESWSPCCCTSYVESLLPAQSCSLDHLGNGTWGHGPAPPETRALISGALQKSGRMGSYSWPFLLQKANSIINSTTYHNKTYLI